MSTELDSKDENCFKCFDCDRSFKDIIHLVNHEKLVHPKKATEKQGVKKFCCNQCPKTFRKTSERIRHLYIHMSDRTRPFKCSKCESSYFLQYQLRNHEKLKHNIGNRKLWKCKFCGLVSAQRTHLKAHEKTHTKDHLMKCEFCDDFYLKFATLAKHLKEDHGQEHRFECSKCGAKFWFRVLFLFHRCGEAKGALEKAAMVDCSVCGKIIQKRGLENHLKIHVDEKPFKCPHCERRFLAHKNVLNHIKKNHKIREPVACEICGKMIKGKMKNHLLRIHVVEKNFKCSQCPKAYASQEFLSMHMKRHEKIHGCEDCGRKFSHAVELRNHLKSHKNEKKFPCPICGDLFSRKDFVRRHTLRIHTQVNRVQCHFCDEMFKSNTTRVYHERRRHGQGEKTKKCPHCDMKFFTTSEVKLHKGRIHDNLRPFKCDICGRRFFINYELKTHKLLHSDIRPFFCEICQTGFTTQRNLKRHFRRFHPGIVIPV